MPDLGPAGIVGAYRAMVLARVADAKAVSLQRQGRLYTLPPNLGQEAAAVGSAMALEKTDWMVPAYRELGAWHPAREGSSPLRRRTHHGDRLWRDGEDPQQAMIDLKKESISVELIDARSLYPLDTATIVASVKKTGHLLVAHEAPESYGAAAEIIARVAHDAFYYLETPPARLAGHDTVPPLPKSEDLYFFGPERVAYEVKRAIAARP